MADVAVCRLLKRGCVGADVIAHKRAVSRFNPNAYGWHEFTPLYGQFFENAVRQFQARKGLPADGVIGPVTHTALENARNVHGDPVFDATAAKLAADFCREFGKTPEQKIREAIVTAGYFWWSHRAAIAYSQYRPFQLGKPSWVPTRWDCSAYVTACHYAGGAPNPNRRSYDDHLGYTGTLMLGGVHVGSWRDLDPGDLVFYGYSSGKPGFRVGDPTHVALYVGDGMVLSHGSYPMALRSVTYRTVNHYRHLTVA